MKIQKQNKLLKSINTMHLDFLNIEFQYGWCENILKDLIYLSESEFGFICELLHKDDGTPFVRSHAISNIAWNKKTREYYEKNYENGLDFFNFDSLWGEAIKTGEAVIANDPHNDPRRGGYPKEDGHPVMNKLLCLPIKDSNGNVVGAMAVANRKNGYDHELVEFLDPFVTTYGVLIEKHRIEERRKKLEQELSEQKEIAEKMAITDALTGLYNRRFFNEVFTREHRRFLREGTALTFCILDVDHFKKYNDSYGHQAGDDVLKRIGKIMVDTIQRPTDYVFRIGGEEFGIIFCNMERENSQLMAEKVREAVEKLNIPHKRNSASSWVTVSIGFVFLDENHKITDSRITYNKADQALYQAKEQGRNKVIGV